MDGRSNYRDKAGVLKTPPASLKSVFEKVFFRDGLVWTAGLTAEIKFYSNMWTGPRSSFTPTKRPKWRLLEQSLKTSNLHGATVAISR